MAAVSTEPHYSNDDWQAQLEEMLALQSIFAENFRLTHVPGQSTEDNSSGIPGEGGGSSSSSGGASSSTGCLQIHDLEEQLQLLMGGDPPSWSTACGLLTCEAMVHVELPAGQLLLLLDTQNSSLQPNNSSNISCSTTSSSSCLSCHSHDNTSPTCCGNGNCNSSRPLGPPIKYLPPVRVQLSLPVSYPTSASAPPVVELQACWLAAQHVQQLKQHLQDIWLQQGPGPVCYAWLDFIKESSLHRLGIVTDLVLQSPPVAQAAAAVSPSTRQPQETASHLPKGVQKQSGGSKSGSRGGSTSSSVDKSSKCAGLSAAAAAFDPAALDRVGDAQQQQQQQQHSKTVPRQQQQCHKEGEQLHKQQGSEQQAQQQAWSGASALQHDPQQQQQQHFSVPSVEQLAVQLLRYSAAREVEAFMAAQQTCNICFEQVPGSSCLLLPECGHFYCTTCLKAAAAAQMQLGALDNMRCPEPSCRRPLPPYVIKQLLGEADYAKWEQQLLLRTLDRMEDVVYCPRCDAVCIEDKDHCAQCDNCLYVFCSFCQDSWHPGTECLDPHERLRVLERRRNATGAGDKRHELDLINQAMNLKYLTSCSKKCPSCGMATIKNEGCNKMTCVYCRANWCWKCQQEIDGYDHFRDSRCNMFDQEEINRWNTLMWQNERAREVEMGQIMIQVRRDMVPDAMLCRCPVCGQENLREGRNNLLRCWSCNCHFCYSCRSWLRGKVGQHYIGKGACKQHGS